VPFVVEAWAYADSSTGDNVSLALRQPDADHGEVHAFKEKKE
jgi:hypothetical protein